MNQRKYFRKSLYSLAWSLINQQRHINEHPLSFNLWHLYLCACVCVRARDVGGQAFKWKWTPQMMDQPHDCVHHCELQRWHLHHDRKCDELSISYAYTWAHMLWITVMHSAVGHVWRRLHISVRLRKTWSPWVNQCCTVFHLFHLNSSPKHYKSIIEKIDKNTLLEIHHLIYENKRPSLLKSYQFVN